MASGTGSWAAAAPTSPGIIQLPPYLVDTVPAFFFHLSDTNAAPPEELRNVAPGSGTLTAWPGPCC